jgi:hypothetical protein
VKLSLAGAVLTAATALTAVAGADIRATKRDAQVLREKVAAINAEAAKPSKQGRRTTVTENEVNAYLAYDAGDQIPVGVVEPAVSILGEGRLSGRAVVDLDAFRRQRRPTSIFDPMNYLSGRLPVAASGVLTTKEGVGKFQLESASISSVPIPKLLLQELVSYYSKSPQNPSGINIDDPFALPAKIREIRVGRGQAIIVQ